MRFSLNCMIVASSICAARAADKEKSSPPPFFVQDPKDSLCLDGEEFRRCSVDTLFYVVGSPGSYQIHKRAADGTVDDEDDGTCLSKKSCKDSDISKVAESKLASCSHCGAKNWNILGDQDTGYVLSEGDGKTCLIREGKKAMTAPCDSADHPFTPLQLQFASPAEIETMSTPGALLVGAATEGDKKKVQELLKDGTDVNARDWDKISALIGAASSGHLDICKLLVKEGADVNLQDKDGITALMESSIMGHTAVVDFLVSSGAEVDALTASGVTALWLAASEGQTDVMKSLIKKGADVSNTRSDGITCVLTASVGGHTESIKLLLDNDADPTVTDKDGLTPLMNAAEKGTVDTMKILLDKVEEKSEYLDLVSKTGFTALIISAAHGHVDAVKFLLDAGAGVEVASENNVSAVMYAASADHVECVKALVEKGKANVNAVHSNGGTALLEASTGGSVKSIRYLLEKGALVDGVDQDGVSCLMAIASNGSAEGLQLVLDALRKKKSDAELKEHINMLSYSGGSSIMFAAAGGHMDSTKTLFDLGADPKAIAEATPEYLVRLEQLIAEGKGPEDEHIDGVTALHVAAQGGHLGTADFLLNVGADPNVKDKEGRSPMTLAIKGNHGNVTTALVKAGADPDTEYVDADGVSHNILFNSVMVENEELATALLENGANFEYSDEKKVSVLLQASHRGFSGIVELILKRKPKKDYLNGASEEGVSPLIAASSEGHVDIVQLLLESGADVNQKDNDGTSAVMSAAARGHVDVVKLLIDGKAGLNEQNTDGHTALMFAYNGKNQVETLWERYSQFMRDSAEEGANDADTGPMLRDALDNHTAVVDLLIKRGANQKLKDKEGHVAKDFDFHPEADESVLAKEKKAEQIRDSSKNEL